MNLIDLVKSFPLDPNSKESLVANIGFDAAENEPSTVCQTVAGQLDRFECTDKHRFLWIAEEAYVAPLPPNWSQHYDPQGLFLKSLQGKENEISRQFLNIYCQI